VIFHDPYKRVVTTKPWHPPLESMDELLAQSQVLSLHCPLTEETFHLINRQTIAKMPRGAYLINTARGAVVDTTALPDAIASGHLAAAGIDVLDHEPPPADHPLLVAWRDPRHPAHHRVIITPHSAFFARSLMDMRTKGSDACRRHCAANRFPRCQLRS